MDYEISQSFVEQLNSNINIKTDFESKDYNYDWVEQFEDVIPYIDNILRNPKRFIINEEEVVKVELSKKVTVESIIHLTQHTNLIQDYDEKKGDVKPVKILNINKDESLDTYENRFVFTLLNNMRSFFEKHSKTIMGDSYFKDLKSARYEANTKIGTENVKISVIYESINTNLKNGEDDSETIEDRLKKIKIQLDGFTTSELYQTLNHLHVAPVRSPIRKTNVILKNPNFQKAEQLWNYIQSYVEEDCKVVQRSEDINDVGYILNQFDQTFILDYLAINYLTEKKYQISEKQAISIALSRVIENILDMNDEVLEEKIKSIFTEEFDNAKNKFDRRNERIVGTFKEKLELANKSISEACSSLL